MMQTSPKWTVTWHPGANDKTIPPQYRHALAKRVPCPVTAEIPGAGHYGHHLPPIIR
jgi:pimeloyl-ACP methyl ester carboxylesterase